jgi:hypothetical protein
MSKATKWAESAGWRNWGAPPPPRAYDHRGRIVADVVIAGKPEGQGVAAHLMLRNKEIPASDALALATWIIDTFSEDHA